MERSFQSFPDWDVFTQRTTVENESNALTLLHINIRSLQKHWDQLNVYLLDRLSKLDVIILTEINVDEAACQGFQLNNFSPHYLCREKRRGGGVLTFVRDDWVSERVETTFITAEVVTVSIYRQNESFTVCAVYRPPTNSIVPFCDELSTFLKKI